MTESLVIKCAQGHRAEAGEREYARLVRRVAELEAECDRLRTFGDIYRRSAEQRKEWCQREYDLANELAEHLSYRGHDINCATNPYMGAGECDCGYDDVLTRHEEARK